MSADKLNEAIAVFQAGDRVQARALFQEVISTDPNNDTAWYYFAALQDDPARRRAALQRVLEINPQHQRAKDVLASMDAAQASAGSMPPPASRPATRPQPAQGAPEPDTGRPASSGTGGFTLPVSVPGAPERVTLGGLWSEWLQLFTAGINALLGKEGVYEAEIARATWWRFWLLVVGLAVISGLVSIIGGLLFSGFFSGLLTALVTLFLTPAIAYAGVWLSYWWAQRQGTNAPQSQHALTAALPYVPAGVVSALLSSFIPVVGGLLGFVATLYAYYLMSLAFQSLHQFSDSSQKWITTVFFVLGIIVGGIVLGVIVGILVAPFAIGAAILR